MAPPFHLFDITKMSKIIVLRFPIKSRYFTIEMIYLIKAKMIIKQSYNLA